MSTVILCGVVSKTAKRIRSSLGVLKSASVKSWEESHEGDAADSIVAMNPTVVAFGPDLKSEDRFDLTRKLVAIDPTIGVLIVDKPSEATMRKTLESGARAVLPPYAAPTDMRATFERLLEGTAGLRDGQGGEASRAPIHRTIAVTSAKGGVGKTAFASNIAVALALESPREAVIVDLDLRSAM